MFELGVIKTQLELTFKSLSNANFAIFRQRISKMNACPVLTRLVSLHDFMRQISASIPTFSENRLSPFAKVIRGADLVRRSLMMIGVTC